MRQTRKKKKKEWKEWMREESEEGRWSHQKAKESATKHAQISRATKRPNEAKRL